MADRVTLADGTALDMLDPLSIRAYVRRTLAMTTEPSQGQLRRLEMLEDHAAKLEAEAPAQGLPAKLVLVDAKDAAEELAKRLGTR
jgi:hypothetical protein